jgi:hypothetical protein
MTASSDAALLAQERSLFGAVPQIGKHVLRIVYIGNACSITATAALQTGCHLSSGSLFGTLLKGRLCGSTVAPED